MTSDVLPYPCSFGFKGEGHHSLKCWLKWFSSLMNVTGVQFLLRNVKLLAEWLDPKKALWQLGRLEMQKSWVPSARYSTACSSSLLETGRTTVRDGEIKPLFVLVSKCCVNSRFPASPLQIVYSPLWQNFWFTAHFKQFFSSGPRTCRRHARCQSAPSHHFCFPEVPQFQVVVAFSA